MGIRIIWTLLLISFASSANSIEIGNGGGILVVHTKNEVYSANNDFFDAELSCAPNYDDCTVQNQEDCSAEQANLNPSMANIPGSSTSHVFYVLAAFPPDKCPRMTGVTFGLNYDANNIGIVGHSPAGDAELSQANWPAPLTGTSVIWDSPEKAQLTEVYWFAAYAYYAAGEISLTPNPNQGGFFADDSTPPILEQIQGYGTLGLAGAVGTNPYMHTPTREQSWGQIKRQFH